MQSPAPRAAAVPRAVAVAASLLWLALLGPIVGCGGGGSGTLGLEGTPGVELFPLEVQPLGAPLAPIGLLATRVLEWRANQPGEYRVTLRAGGEERLLANGLGGAYETVRVSLKGAELALAAPSQIRFSLVDPIGRTVAITQELELKAFDVLPLGQGHFTDLAFDALREELVVAEAGSGELRVIDVDEDGAAYGATVATLATFAAPGPLRVALGADGRRGYALDRLALHEHDRDTLELLDEPALPSPADPAGLTLTPDAGRVYLSHPTTLLLQHVDAAGDPAPLEGTGIVDPELARGELAVTPDGTRLLYAWEGAMERGLWAIGCDPHAPDFHELVVDRRFAPAPAAPGPDVSIAESGRAAFVLGLEGLAKLDLEQPGMPTVTTRDDLPAIAVVAVAAGGLEFVLAPESGGALWVLDDRLELLGGIDLPAGLGPRTALDRATARLFLLRTTDDGAGELVVLPLQ